MSQPTEIIVYRNPLEKAIWDSLLGSGDYSGLFLLIGVGVSGLLACLYLNSWRTARKSIPYAFMRHGHDLRIGLMWLAVFIFAAYKAFFPV